MPFYLEQDIQCFHSLCTLSKGTIFGIQSDMQLSNNVKSVDKGGGGGGDGAGQV